SLDELGHQRLVLGEEPPLHAPLGGAAEKVESRAAQAPPLREKAEDRQHPLAVSAFLKPAADRIARGEGGRREVEAEAIVAFDLFPDLREEVGLGPEPRDLILVLDRHALEEAACDRIGEAGPPRRLLALGALDLADELLVAPRVGGVLVLREERRAAADHLVERLGRRRRLARHRDALYRREIVRCTPSPEEGGLVEGDGDAVELDRALDRFGRERHEALLPC